MTDVNDVGELYFDKVKAHTHYKDYMPASVMNKFDIFRTRKINLEYEDIEAVRTFAHPSPEYCKWNGRANVIGKPVFYGSIDKFASLAEVDPEVGIEHFVSLWQIKNEGFQFVSFFTDDLPENNTFSDYAKKFYNTLIYHYTNEFPNQARQLKYLIDWINARFKNDVEPYTISSMIGYMSLYRHEIQKTPDFDAVLYPSAKTDWQGVNIAFRPGYVEDNMEMMKAYWIRVNHRHDSKMTYQIQQIGDVVGENKNIVIWRPPTMFEDMAGIKGIVTP